MLFDAKYMYVVVATPFNESSVPLASEILPLSKARASAGPHGWDWARNMATQVLLGMGLQDALPLPLARAKVKQVTCRGTPQLKRAQSVQVPAGDKKHIIQLFCVKM